MNRREVPALAGRLQGCAVLPPLVDDPPEPPQADGTATNARKAKGKPVRRRTGDRFKVLNAFLDLTAGRLTRSELLVWLMLYRDTRDGIAKTGQADLARRTGLGRRSVCLATGRLEQRGLLTVVHRGGLNRGASVYRVRPLERDLQRAQSVAP